MELKEDTEVLGIWFAGGIELDWMAIVTVGNGSVGFEMRFRYYVDGNTFGSQDKKNWYDGAKPDTPENRKAIMGLMEEGYKKAVEFGLMERAKFKGGTGKEAFEWLRKQSFCDVREATPEEKEKFDRDRKNKLN